jgi:hypothetical protein
MKLDELLKNSRKPIADGGFTDQVMKRVLKSASAAQGVRQKSFLEWLKLSDLPWFEIGLIAVALFFARPELLYTFATAGVRLYFTLSESLSAFNYSVLEIVALALVVLVWASDAVQPRFSR